MTAATISQGHLLTVRDVAERLQLSYKATVRIVRRGEMGSVRLGSGPKAQYRVPVQAFDEYLARHYRPAVGG